MAQPTQENSPKTSDVEKTDLSGDHDKERLAQFEDPDEGLSEEERAKIVRLWSLSTSRVSSLTHIGSRPALEARLEIGSLVESTLSYFLLGSVSAPAS